MMATRLSGQILHTRRTQRIIRAAYGNAHLVLWVLGIGAVCFSNYMIPELQAARTRAEQLRAQTVSGESTICEKWGMAQGTHAHIVYILDLQEIRANVQKRIAEDSDF